ncbi:MAG: glycosyl hydrolase [Bacteroidota bacterium]
MILSSKKHLISLFIILLSSHLFSQKNDIDTTVFNSKTFADFKLRNIGPGFMSGRIADIAINPSNYAEWYVAVGSGGVWKTSNAGITWNPIFEKEKVYSTGCLSIDPSNNNTIWLGTGENVGGRHVSYGDGVYISKDAGASWKNMGLTKSEHISKIIIHPTNSNIVWVAAQGPLWNKGGERGLFKTTDGGKTWKNTLKIDEWTGVTDIVINPGNPDILYAASWQRHRNVTAYMGGGPGTSIYKSTDGGDTWDKIDNGLPKSDMGKIGLAISPQKPDILYAAIELERRKGAFYKSTDAGASWKKQSETVSGATGPHYYQELYADPHQFDKVYLVDVRMQITTDGGKTFNQMKEEFKHSDNHAIAFRKNDPNYLLVGTDGGLYESYDLAENWRFIDNLPVTQYYKLALDDTEPFYNIYGGTQDNNTQVGPSRTDNKSGIRNADWEVVLFGDGHQPATEPGNPDIAYAEWQQGNLVRFDRKTGELVYIQPQPEKGEKEERFNWDAPILISPHNPQRLYFASQRVWKSENRGDSWTAISKDLTLNQERFKLPIMEQTWGWDSSWDVFAMSTYNTITSLSESPVKEGVICAGTDDGRIQITENGGESWREIPVNKLPKCPETAFINDIKFDQFDQNTLYVVLDNHKFGDYKPYIYKSTNLGKSWKSISSNIPDGNMVWRIVQDHVKPELMFAATEFGIYFTIDSGKKWIKLSGDVPTISFRDLAIHKRENDLVAASFGRGFFVFDDYSPLRGVSKKQLEEEATLFTPRTALWYMPRAVLGMDKRGSQGAGMYLAPNPDFGTSITYYLKDSYKSLKEIRKEKEKELKKENKAVKFPDWKEMDKELLEQKPKIWLTITNNNGDVVRKISAPTTKGFHRITWDLLYPSQQPVAETEIDKKQAPKGIMAAPGMYSISLSKEIAGVVTLLSDSKTFEVKQMRKGSLNGSTPDNVVKFWNEVEKTISKNTLINKNISKAIKRIKKYEISAKNSATKTEDLSEDIYKVHMRLLKLEAKMNGSKSKRDMMTETSESSPIMKRIYNAGRGTMMSTYGPTPTHIRSLEIANEELDAVNEELNKIVSQYFVRIEEKLKKAGAPAVVE